jgi:hypothetical protein
LVSLSHNPASISARAGAKEAIHFSLIFDFFVSPSYEDFPKRNVKNFSSISAYLDDEMGVFGGFFLLGLSFSPTQPEIK